MGSPGIYVSDRRKNCAHNSIVRINISLYHLFSSHWNLYCPGKNPWLARFVCPAENCPSPEVSRCGHYQTLQKNSHNWIMRTIFSPVWGVYSRWSAEWALSLSFVWYKIETCSLLIFFSSKEMLIIIIPRTSFFPFSPTKLDWQNYTKQ